MSRTRRIYNRKHWKWHAEGHIKYLSPFWMRKYVATDEDVQIGNITGKLLKEVSRESEWFYTGSFFYHPYNQVCMGCCLQCGAHRIRERRTRRRKIKTNEQQYEKYWREEL